MVLWTGLGQVCDGVLDRVWDWIRNKIGVQDPAEIWNLGLGTRCTMCFGSMLGTHFVLGPEMLHMVGA